MEREREEKVGEGKKEGRRGWEGRGEGPDPTGGRGGQTVHLGYHQRKMEAETLNTGAPGPAQQTGKSEFLAGGLPNPHEPRLRKTHQSADVQ